MQSKRFKIRHLWYWIVGFAAFIWILMRSGLNPKRITYPCQRAALPLAANWVLAIIAFTGGSLFLRKFVKLTAAPLIIVGLIWFVGSIPDLSRGDVKDIASLPIWEVDNPVSVVCVMDSVPPTSGSLAPGDSTVPDAYLSDPAIDTLLAMLETQGVYLLETSTHPDGIVDEDEVVIIKGNFQWTSRNTTSTDRIKGLIWQILRHPDGFSGEIIVCDNTQEIGTGINQNDNNSEDTEQSIVDVVNTFYDKGYPVYRLDWNYIWDVVADEYMMGDYNDGYVYEPATKISYPKFQTPEHYISLHYGIWDSISSSYDPSDLCIIDFPVLKAHSMAGATIAVKNWIGTLTTAYAGDRYGGWDEMHYDYLFSSYALVSRVMEVTYPELTIIDAAWTTTFGPHNLTWIEETNILLASTDPVASSWYAAKFILTPIARYPGQTNPDIPYNKYGSSLGNWTDYLRNTAGLPCTMDSTEISVYDRSILQTLPTVSIDMIPDITPVTVSRGGTIEFTGILTNNTSSSQSVDVGIYLKNVPWGGLYGPLAVFYNIPLDPYEVYTDPNASQYIPGNAILGDYTYIAFCGDYPSAVYDSAWFDFTITGGVTSGSDDWNLSAWERFNNSTIPQSTELLGNYPNPFNSSTGITYTLSSKCLIKLEVFNILGEKITTLVNSVQQSGEHSITWDAADFSSGIYFLKLSSDEKTYTKLMTLLK
ncbi:MAG: DUF362 domain-containing protein [candidate division Zixibacteria bacterium]|nr:DUF362 domain-containing protein [candidate division Zixibacteria bacterium]